MKKLRVLIILIALFGIVSVVNAAPTGSSGMSLGECMSFANSYHTITRSEGQYYYRYCFQASCSNGRYLLANKVMTYGYACANGNYNPYKKVTSDGCKSYTGSCDAKKNTSSPYCTTVEFVDCNKNADGSAYVEKTQPTTVATTQATTQKPTTKQTVKTTRKTTKSSVSQITIPVTQPTTEKVTEPPKKSSNTNIKKILINDFDIKYDNSRSDITLEVSETTTELDFDVELEDPIAVFTIENNKNLSLENNVVTLNVFAEDGTQKTVKFTLEFTASKSSDCRLSNIYIEGYELDFDKNQYDYKLTVKKNVNSLDITAVPVAEISTKVNVEDVAKLEHKSEINIVAVAESGDVCNYKITVLKESSFWKFLILIVLVVAGLITGVVVFYKRMKKSKGKYVYE